MPEARATPRVGETWQLAVQFSAPPSASQARSLLRDHISSRARVVAGALNLREAEATWSIDELRAQVAARIDARVADPSAAALLAALQWERRVMFHCASGACSMPRASRIWSPSPACM